MATYKIAVIREGREADFVSFWEHGSTKNAQGEVLHSDLVGFTKIIEAKSLNEAISKAELLYPNLSVSRAYSAKIG